jgi:hypothetical protein
MFHSITRKSMISGLEIWRAANLLIDQHGTDAETRLAALGTAARVPPPDRCN